jgi:hypothetical protein
VVIEPEQAPAMRSLFASVFGHAMSAEHWTWKYVQGQGRGAGLLRDGVMLAHYGGVARRIAYFGQAQRACQVCDVMVEPSANRALVRRGPLYKVAAAFLEAEVGLGRPHLVAFGFPSARHHAVAKRLGLYDQVDEVVRVSWPGAQGDVEHRVGLRPMGQTGTCFDASDRKVVDRLWRQMALGFQANILGVRDADWLQYRYLQHPQLKYEMLLVHSRWLRRPLGALVFRRHPDHLHWLDWIGPPETIHILLAVVRHLAAASGLGRVDAWITRSQLHRLVRQNDQDATVVDLQIPLPTIVHTLGPALDTLRDRWFLTAGDADFT